MCVPKHVVSLKQATATSVRQEINAKIRTTSILATILAITSLATTDLVSRASAFAVAPSSLKKSLTTQHRIVKAHFIRLLVQIFSWSAIHTFGNTVARHLRAAGVCLPVEFCASCTSPFCFNAVESGESINRAQFAVHVADSSMLFFVGSLR